MRRIYKLIVTYYITKDDIIILKIQNKQKLPPFY